MYKVSVQSVKWAVHWILITISMYCTVALCSSNVFDRMYQKVPLETGSLDYPTLFAPPNRHRVRYTSVINRNFRLRLLGL